MKARGLVRLVRGGLAGWAAALSLACDAPPTALAIPASVEVPATSVPATCRGDGRWRCQDPEPTEPPAPTMDSIWVHPLHAKWEVGESMKYWMIGWYGGVPYSCAADGGGFVGRIAVNANWLRGAQEQVWTPQDIKEPEPGDPTVIPDMAVCEMRVEFEDTEAVEWTLRSFFGDVTAWLRDLFA